MTKKRSATNTYYYEKTLLTYLGRGSLRSEPKEGAEVGIEIEVEGVNLPTVAPKGWEIHPDGSLRGESNEYVFRGPAPRSEVRSRLEALNKALAGSTINQSYRTSVHVHVNQQDVKIKDIFSQILLFMAFEDVLTELCGKERIGNLFTLRAKDAEYYSQSILNAIREDRISVLNDQHLRYTACNPYSLFSHGTLEYRSMRGTTDIEIIQDWVNLLLSIKDASINYFVNPIQIVQDVSSLGPVDFALKIFTPEQLKLFNEGWENKLMGGIRDVQHLAHAHDWLPEPEVKAKAKAPPTYSRYTATAADVENNIRRAMEQQLAQLAQQAPPPPGDRIQFGFVEGTGAGLGQPVWQRLAEGNEEQ